VITNKIESGRGRHGAG